MPVVLTFIAISYGLAWLVALPLWLSGQGLATPGAQGLLVVMMVAPTIAALVTARIFGLMKSRRRPDPNKAGFLALTGLKPQRPFRHWVKFALLGWFAPIAVVAASLLLALALGLFHVDLVHFSGAAEQLDALTNGAELPMPLELLVLTQFLGIFIAPLFNAIPALGEELGWRGFLQPQLRAFPRLGRWGAMVATGVIWGLWHAPVILLGYNYPGYPPLAALAFMVVFCVLMAILLGWMQEASGSIYPAAIAHGSINGAVGMGGLAIAAGTAYDPAVVGPLGWTGWIVLGACVAWVLIASRRRMPRVDAPTPETAASGLNG